MAAFIRLIALMQDDTLGCVAGEAFNLLTCIDLKQQLIHLPLSDHLRVSTEMKTILR